MKINVMQAGDETLFVNQDFVAVKRKNGEVDLIPIVTGPDHLIRIDTSQILTIGYGANTVETEAVSGAAVTTF